MNGTETHHADPPGARVKRELLVVALFLALSIVFTWPLVTHMSTHLSGGFFDARQRLWRYWWHRHALLNGINPRFSHLTLYPTGQNLTAWDAFPVDCAVTFALQTVMATVPAINVYVLLMLILSGYATYRLGRGLGLGAGPAIVAGLVYAFSPQISGVVHNGSYPHAAAGWLPLAALGLWRLAERRPWRWVVLAAAALVLQASSSGYLAISAAYTAVVLGAAVLVVSVARRRARATALRLASAALLTAAGVMLLDLPRFAEVLTHKGLGTGPGLDFIGQVQRFVVPRTGLMIEGPGPAERACAPTYLCWSAILLALVSAAVRPRRRDLAWWALLVVGVVMALGPVLKINGDYPATASGRRILLPYYWLMMHVPGLSSAFNTPRVLPGGTLALAVLAGLGLHRLRDRVPRMAGLATVLVGALVYAESVLGSPVPFPRVHIPVEVPAFYRRIAGSPERFALFEVPVRRSGEYWYGAMVHGRPVVNWLPERPARNHHEYAFGRSNPLAQYLQRWKPRPVEGEARAPFPDPPDLALWRRLRIKYIVFHRGRYRPDEFDDPAAGEAEVEGHLRDLFGPPVDGWKSDWDDAVVFRVYDTPDLLTPAAQVATLKTVAGWCIEGREHELAYRHLQRAEALAPGPDADLQYRMAYLADRLGLRALALSHLDRALEIDPDHGPARGLLAIVRSQG